jgi:adenylosuccinate lyase
LVVNRPVIAKNVREFLPYTATENLMMAAVAAGADRQEVHEVVRRHSLEVAARVKEVSAAPTELLDRLRADPAFTKVDFEQLLGAHQFVGRAPEQVNEFVALEVIPVRQRYVGRLGQKEELGV